MTVFDLKIGAVVTPHQLSNVFRHDFMKWKLGVSFDHLTRMYVVRVQNGEARDVQPYDRIVYLGLRTWKVERRDTY